MPRKYRAFIASAAVLIGVVWVTALALLVSQQGSMPAALPTLVALPSAEPTLVAVLPQTPLPIASPIPYQPVLASNPQSVPATTQPNNTQPASSTEQVASFENWVRSTPWKPVPIPQEPVANQAVIQFAAGTTAEEQAAY